MYGPGPNVRNIYADGNTNTRVGDQNLHGPGSSVRNIYLESNANGRVGDQNLFGPGPSVENYYERSNLRSIPMPLGNNEVNTSPGGSSLIVASSDVNYRGQVDDQNLHGRQSPQTELNTECGGVNYHPNNLHAVPRPNSQNTY